MNRKIHHILALAIAALLTACTDQEVHPDGPTDLSGKTPIELSVGGVDAPEPALTRAVITDGTGKTLRAFTAPTRLFFAFVADNAAENEKKFGFNYGTAAGVSNPAVNSKSAITFPDNYLYWDDAYARDSKVSVYSIAVANKERGNVKLTPLETVAIGTESPGQPIIPFTTTDPGSPTFKWQIGSSDGGSAFKQDQTIFEWADLVFSNNIANYTSAGGTDNRLKFHTETGSMFHKFDQGELIYYHALTQFTIKIKCGEGFTGNGDDFKFTNASGVACTPPNNSFGLNGFYGANGVFLIGQGEFQTMSASNIRNYTSIYKVSETHQLAAAGDYYVLKAYVFPGTDMTGTMDNAFSFIIDGNQYDVSLASLKTALANGTTGGSANVLANILTDGKYLKAGYNYEFTFTVGKSKINNITAQVADWESVTADDIDPSNARITLNLEERNNNDNSNVLGSGDAFSLYRAADNNNTGAINDDYTAYNWAKTYNNTGANLQFIAASGTTPAHWKTDWYWDNNKNFYHFRALCEQTSSAKQAVSNSLSNDATYGDYLTLSHCEKTASASYKDILWGSPMKDVEPGNETSDASTLKWNYGPTTYGFDGLDNKAANAHQIYKAIGPTENAIKLILFHMMSDVTFKVKTSGTTDPDRVNLGDGNTEKTTIELQKIHTSGKLFMGNGLVQGSTSNVANSNYTFTTTPAPDTDRIITWANYGAIPQDLTNVVLVITTPDHNQYKVAMKDVLATTVSNTNIANPYTQSGSKYIIDRWYPGFKYTYTFKLTKKGITDLQATIVDWENVTAGDDNVQIQ